MFGHGGFLDHEDTVARITLFAKEVLPRLLLDSIHKHKKPSRQIGRSVCLGYTRARPKLEPRTQSAPTWLIAAGNLYSAASLIGPASLFLPVGRSKRSGGSRLK
jgi:hypothetical protein